MHHCALRPVAFIICPLSCALCAVSCALRPVSCVLCAVQVALRAAVRADEMPEGPLREALVTDRGGFGGGRLCYHGWANLPRHAQLGFIHAVRACVGVGAVPGGGKLARCITGLLARMPYLGLSCLTEYTGPRGASAQLAWRCDLPYLPVTPQQLGWHCRFGGPARVGV